MDKVKHIFVYRPLNVLLYLFKEERRSSIYLLLATVAALVIANGPLANAYFSTFDIKLNLLLFEVDVKHFINEGLMALFFLIVTLEIRRELVEGELKTWRRAAFPVFAALGGMLVPALIYILVNPSPPESRGWAIPMATDIALAIGILGLLGNKVNKSMRVFLLSLAIVDDIASIAVISIFYTRPEHIAFGMFALLLAGLLIVVKNRHLPAPILVVVGVLLWLSLIKAGISGVLAGTIFAFALPLDGNSYKRAARFNAETVEELLLPLTSFIIVPLFAFANAGVKLDISTLSQADVRMVMLGIILGLVVGKPLGIYLFAKAAVWLGIAYKPHTLRWQDVSSLGFLAGIGFTVSLLISSLAFNELNELRNAAIIAVMIASVIAAAIALVLLTHNLKHDQAHSKR